MKAASVEERVRQLPPEQRRAFMQALRRRRLENCSVIAAPEVDGAVPREGQKRGTPRALLNEVPPGCGDAPEERKLKRVHLDASTKEEVNDVHDRSPLHARRTA